LLFWGLGIVDAAWHFWVLVSQGGELLPSARYWRSWSFCGGGSLSAKPEAASLSSQVKETSSPKALSSLVGPLVSWKV